MATKFDRLVSNLGCYLPLKSHDPLIMWSWRSRDKLKLLYLHYTVSMSTRLGRMMTYLEGVLSIKSIKSFSALITWSFKVTKTIISPLPECLWPPDLAE